MFNALRHAYYYKWNQRVLDKLKKSGPTWIICGSNYPLWVKASIESPRLFIVLLPLFSVAWRRRTTCLPLVSLFSSSGLGSPLLLKLLNKFLTIEVLTGLPRVFFLGISEKVKFNPLSSCKLRRVQSFSPFPFEKVLHFAPVKPFVADSLNCILFLLLGSVWWRHLGEGVWTGSTMQMKSEWSSGKFSGVWQNCK